MAQSLRKCCTERPVPGVGPGPGARARTGVGRVWVGRSGGGQHRQSQGRTGLSELERDMVLGRSGAMFGGQGQLGAFAAQVEIGVAPAMEFAGTAQGLARDGCRWSLCGRDEPGGWPGETGAAVRAGRRAGGDLGGVVFIDPMKSDQRIQDQQAWVGGARRCAARRWRSAGVSSRSEGAVMTSTGKASKANLSGCGDAFQALADDGQRVFGREEQHRCRCGDRELAQAGRAGSDADGQVQGQEAFAALGFAAEDADGLIGPESFDQPWV